MSNEIEIEMSDRAIINFDGVPEHDIEAGVLYIPLVDVVSYLNNVIESAPKPTSSEERAYITGAKAMVNALVNVSSITPVE